MTTKVVQLHSRPILQVTYEDLERLLREITTEDRFLSIKEAAKVLGRSEDFVQSLEDAGVIKAYYDKRDTVTRNAKSYKYSELMNSFSPVRLK